MAKSLIWTNENKVQGVSRTMREARFRRRRSLLASLLLLTTASSAAAQPPPGADPNSEIGKWFKSLKSNKGLPCCDVSDCRRVQAQLVNGYYEALIDERWARVPDDKITNVENPIGQYVACYTYYEASGDAPPLFYCFVPISPARLEPYRQQRLQLANWRRASTAA